jgi:hypothetical protein
MDSEECDLAATPTDGVGEDCDEADGIPHTPEGEGDAAAANLDAKGDIAVDATYPIADAPDVCTLRQVDDSAGIFVSPSGIDGTSCGTRQAPCLSVQAGINNAGASSRALVYLAPGLYVESISLVAGVSVEGGWSVQGDVWAADCRAQSNATTAIQAPANQSTTVLVDAINGASAIRRITVRSKVQANVMSGESLYGIFARDDDPLGRECCRPNGSRRRRDEWRPRGHTCCGVGRRM